ncbi:MAG: GNAT family N-acetyltransferase [Oscillospiraceae bacterium]|nr:GNAT family N-acetyltransferase [Oscillospiraceae bacterium]
MVLLPLEQADIPQFKADMQEAFQLGYEAEFGKSEEQILPEQDIDRSLSADGAAAFKAVENGKMIGGAIVQIDAETQHNSLDFLYVKYGVQSRGIGRAIWSAIEHRYPDTAVWHTCTPYFEKRNIHFYVNICKFHIVEFLWEHHPSPDSPEDFIGDGGEGMFEFEKQMR